MKEDQEKGARFADDDSNLPQIRQVSAMEVT
jgi:hypothetical protein